MNSTRMRGVLVFLNLCQFSAEFKETGSSGATEKKIAKCKENEHTPVKPDLSSLEAFLCLPLIVGSVV